MGFPWKRYVVSGLISVNFALCYGGRALLSFTLTFLAEAVKQDANTTITPSRNAHAPQWVSASSWNETQYSNFIGSYYISHMLFEIPFGLIGLVLPPGRYAFFSDIIFLFHLTPIENLCWTRVHFEVIY